ncbi:MAG: ABC transporter ATP-binding protein [Microthrixaceae bacterium]
MSLTFPDGEESLHILRDVSLELAPGETVALVGASGSGKSTLLAIAGLLRRPDTGEVLVDGVATNDLTPAQRTKVRGDKVGLVFQSSNLFPSLTAREQLHIAAHVTGSLDDAHRRRADELLDMVGLASRSNRRPAMLSGGERQRVGIARALMNQPAVLLADEPTAALDPRRGAEVMELLCSTAGTSGVGTLIVTHNTAHLDHVDRVVELRDGVLHQH